MNIDSAAANQTAFINMEFIGHFAEFYKGMLLE